MIVAEGATNEQAGTEETDSADMVAVPSGEVGRPPRAMANFWPADARRHMGQVATYYETEFTD